MEIYLDNAATTRVCREAAEKAMEIMTVGYGNPSSTYKPGRMAAAELKLARSRVATALGALPEELVFTSGGTESDVWAVTMGARAVSRHGRHIISSHAEHDAVRKAVDSLESDGFEVTRLRPDSSGAVSLRDFESALREDTVFVTLMLANNETGAVTDIAGISRLLKARCPKALLHTDAVQAFLKLPFTPKELGADLLSISGHKIHAPKGIGALYIRKGLRLAPLFSGGGQESERRAGTEPMPQICALGVAAELGLAALDESAAHMRRLQQGIISRLEVALPGLVVIGSASPHILSLSLPGHRSEVLMNALEAREIYVSKSSACKKGRRSHVLESMGLAAPVIDGALRIGLSRYSSDAECEAFCDALIEVSRSIRTRG